MEGGDGSAPKLLMIWEMHARKGAVEHYGAALLANAMTHVPVGRDYQRRGSLQGLLMIMVRIRWFAVWVCLRGIG